jgi:uncharacterized protein involved in exopolysaccharide biosynthesis
MNPAPHLTFGPKEIARLLVTYQKRWLVPAVVVAVSVAVYAVVAPATWEASQALIVRNDAANNETAPGKFKQPEEMKTIQETILELVKSRGVLEAALQEIGPPTGRANSSHAWPADRDIETLRKNVKLSPPKGAEFGKTEVSYLEVRASDRERAIELNRAICGQLQTRFQRLRDAKAQSMIDELLKTVHLAQADLKESTGRLAAIETHVGSDLAELRALQEPAAGDSALRRTATEIRGELREICTAEKTNQEFLAVLKAAQDDPGRLLAAPNRLLESQPALRRLKEGLVEAQLRTAALQASMSGDHPRVQAARQTEEEIGRHLHDELSIAIRGVEVDLRVNRNRKALLEEQLAQATQRLDRLAQLRAGYANEAAENAHRTTLVARAQQNLAEARAAQASAKAASLISRIDAPDTGMRPVGPTTAMMLLLGIAGGLATGLGVLLLSVPPPAPAATGPAPPRPAATPILPSNGNLTIKQALEKIVCGSKA